MVLQLRHVLGQLKRRNDVETEQEENTLKGNLGVALHVLPAGVALVSFENCALLDVILLPMSKRCSCGQCELENPPIGAYSLGERPEGAEEASEVPAVDLIAPAEVEDVVYNYIRRKE